MGWERDCASSVRDLMKVVNKAGNIGVGVVVATKSRGDKMVRPPGQVHNGDQEAIDEDMTKFEDEIGWMKRDVEKVIALCKMDKTERAAMMQEVESMRGEVHDMYRTASTRGIFALSETWFKESVKLIDNYEKEIEDIAHKAAINNISEGKGV